MNLPRSRLEVLDVKRVLTARKDGMVAGNDPVTPTESAAQLQGIDSLADSAVRTTGSPSTGRRYVMKRGDGSGY